MEGREKYIQAAASDPEIADTVRAMLAETETIVDSDAVPEPANSRKFGSASPASSLRNGAALGRFVIVGEGEWAAATAAVSKRLG